MAEPERCPGCLQPLPPDAPRGLCPACLLLRAMEGDTAEPPGQDGPGSSTLDNSTPTREYIPGTSTVSYHEQATGAPGDGPAAPSLGFPEFVGRYQLEREIGKGGIGKVIRGRDVEIGREIALKLLREEYRDSDEARLRFVEEAQIGGQLVHPAIVPVYERGTFPDGRPYFVMKLVRGQTLRDLLKSRTDTESPGSLSL